MTASFLWHDYETFGADPRRDRPCQFAALRTNPELEPIAEPMDLFCAPADDVLPHPDAVLITGITPQAARDKGMIESDFAQTVFREMAEPGTCSAGYNSFRFDDEVSRFLFWRNFIDPYAREFRAGNSRWDLIDLVRQCYALRPEGIQWPSRDDGAPSFKLTDLSAANELQHEEAHDALSDVRATLALARLIRDRQPRLWGWALSLRDKAVVENLIAPQDIDPQAYVHTSSRIPADRGCTSLFVTLAAHPDFRGQVIAMDLMADPQPLLDRHSDDIADLIFAARDDLPEGEERLPIKLLRSNRSPMVAPQAVLQDTDLDRIGLDPDRCQRHLDLLKSSLDEVALKVRSVFTRPTADFDPEAETALYDGFVPHHDQGLYTNIRSAEPDRLELENFPLKDPRLQALLPRYRARNWPESLNPDERKAWDDYRLQTLVESNEDHLTLPAYRKRLKQLQDELEADDPRRSLLADLDQWPQQIDLQ